MNYQCPICGNWMGKSGPDEFPTLGHVLAYYDNEGMAREGSPRPHRDWVREALIAAAHEGDEINLEREYGRPDAQEGTY